MWWLVISVFIFVPCSAQRIERDGTCDTFNQSSINDFRVNITQLQGKWYEIAKYGNQSVNCSTVEYTKLNVTNGNFYQATEYTGSYGNGSSSSILISDEISKAKFDFFNHTNLILAWICENSTISNKSIQSLVILTKNQTRTLSTEELNNIKTFLTDTNMTFDSTNFTPTNHSSEICNKTDASGSGSINSIAICTIILAVMSNLIFN